MASEQKQAVETQLEVELKLGMDEDTWVILREALGTPTQVVRQVNTYFDTRDRALQRSRKLMVRVREGSRLVVTAKDRIVDPGDGVLRTRERTSVISAEDWQRVHRLTCALTDLDVPLCQTLHEEVGGALYPLGSVVNRREAYALPGGYIAEVDRTEFPGGQVDFEVELELRSPDQTLQGARDALLAAAPGVDPSVFHPSTSKYGRFLSAIESMNEPRSGE